MEYYPLKDQPSVFLECVWRTDKYVLVEKINGSETQSQGKDIGEDVPSGVSAVHYQSIEVVLGDAEPEMEAPNCDPEGPDYRNNDSGSLAGPLLQCEEEKQVKGRSPASESPPNCSNTAPEGSSLETSSLSLNPNRLKSKRELKEKVAFVSVKAPAPSRANKLDPSIKGTAEKKEDEADPFFSMLTSGYMKRE